MGTFIASMPLALSALNFLWFTAGFVEFSLRSRSVFAGGAKHRRIQDKLLAATADGDEWHFDLLIYLGALNGALATSVLFQMAKLGVSDVATMKLSLWTWGCAHGSQAIVDWIRIYPSGRWKWNGGLGPITHIDTALLLLDWTMMTLL